MSKIPKLPKGQSRPASPEPTPHNSLNNNNDNNTTTPNMQVLQPRSSSLTRSSSLRRSFIRPPKSSVTPPQKSGSPPPSVGKSPLAKGLPPSGLPTAGITPPRTGLPPKGIPSLPPSGLTPPISVPKTNSPNTKMLSPSPVNLDAKLSSPRNSPLKTSFSRNSPLRSSRIPRKSSLPPDPSQEKAESVTSEKADSISSEMADSMSSGHSDDSRNSSPTPSNISKIPTVKGSTPSSVRDRIETLKNRRLKYPALWGLGAPNFFSEEKEMAGNTSLELLRLGVEELETRVSSLECQMGIQNTELLYNSDDEDKSQQDPEEAYLHELTMELTDPQYHGSKSVTSILGSYSYLKPPLHTSPSTSMSNLTSPTTSMTNLRSPSTSMSNLRSPHGSMSNLRSPSTSMVSLLKRPESPCRSPEKSYNINEPNYTINKGGIKPLSFQRFLSPWADYSEQIDRIINFRKVH